MVRNCQVFVHTCFSDSFLVPLRFTDPFLTASSFHSVGFPGDSAVKNLPANAGDTREVGSIPGSEDPLEEEMATHSSILAWSISWTEKPGRSQRAGHI